MMQSEAIKKQIAKSLPNFPDEVIEQWLYPEVAKHGWPPPWKTILAPYYLEQWFCAQWQKIKIPFDILIERMDKEAYKKVQEFTQCQTKKERGLRHYSLFNLENGADINAKIVAQKINGESIRIMSGHVYLAVYRDYLIRHCQQQGEATQKVKAILLVEVDVWMAEHMLL